MIYAMFKDIDGHTMIFGEEYDWCFNDSENRSPREYPYSYSGHYLWREFDKHNVPKGIESVHSDRMMGWDYDKYKKAFHKAGFADNIKKEKAKEIIEIYYDGKYECVGYAIECNLSNGYPYGIFYIKEKN